MKRFWELILVCIFIQATASAQGLEFSGLEKRIEERTSYEVFHGRNPEFKDHLVIDFEFSILPQTKIGYFFRIKDNESGNRVWNIFYNGQGDKVSIRLNEEGHRSLIKAEIPHSELMVMQWEHFHLEFDSSTDSVRMSIGDKKYSAPCPDLPGKFRPDIWFGRSDHIIDVPTFAIRNLKIADVARSIIFPLDEREGNYAYDDKMRLKGKIINPSWQICESFSWKKIGQFKFRNISGAAYNDVRKEFYYFTRDSILTYNIIEDKIYKRRFSSSCPVNFKLGNCSVSSSGKWLFVYELYFEQGESTPATIARLDLDDMQWTPLSTSVLDMPMHHHACFLMPGNDHYTIFGGFGNMMYNGRFFSLDENYNWVRTWPDKDSLSVKIWPRYFTSIGTDRDRHNAYVFGGMGNECGEQIVGREYYYDLHHISLPSGEVTKLWSLDWKEANKVPVRNMIIRDSVFYTLCYPEYLSSSSLSLYEFSIKDGSYRTIANPIPIISDKMRTNANLYLDSDISKLFATTLVFSDDISSEFTIWTMNYPPVPENVKDRHNWLSVMPLWLKLLILLSAAAAIIAAISVIFKLLQMRSNNVYIPRSCPERRIYRQTVRPNAIYLFGDFLITDRDGNDITSRFTPQQQMILLLLIKRINDNGMSSKRLSNILWPDKEEDKVKSSRGVAINHLRKSLSNLDGVNIVFRDGRYILEYDDRFYCDYAELSTLAENEEADLKRILDVTSRGKFLKSNDDPVFDSLKEKVDNRIVPILQKEIQNKYASRQWQAVCEIADILFWIDPVDDQALKYYVSSLKKMKMVEEALVVFARFSSDYRKMFGNDYEEPFKTL